MNNIYFVFAKFMCSLLTHVAVVEIVPRGREYRVSICIFELKELFKWNNVIMRDKISITSVKSYCDDDATAWRYNPLP